MGARASHFTFLAVHCLQCGAMNDLPLRVKRRWTEEEGVSGSTAGWRIAQSVKLALQGQGHKPVFKYTMAILRIIWAK